MNPILSVLCEEPKGTVTRKVYSMELSRENLHTFWQKSSKFPILFNSDVRGDFTRFCELFLEQNYDGTVVPRGLLWMVDEDMVGVFYLTEINFETADAVAHFSFFDGRLRGRFELVKRMIDFVFHKYQLYRLTVKLPAYVAPATMGFTKKLGFKIEGKTKGTSLKDDKRYDTFILGLLHSEAVKSNGST